MTQEHAPPSRLWRWAKRLTFTVGLLIAAGAAGLAWYLVSPPSPVDLPVADPLVSASSELGAQRIQASDSVDLAPLQAAFQPQERQAWCGVASIATVLSALGRPTSQQGVFTPEASEVRGAWTTTTRGMTLADLAGLFASHDLKSTAYFADAVDITEFRDALMRDTLSPEGFVVINYDRRALEQVGAGHISPVGAYDAESDSALVLDVAAHKYPPVWVPLDLLWTSMQSEDPDSGRSRGFVVVQAL